jgi:hypothetical protein
MFDHYLRWIKEEFFTAVIIKLTPSFLSPNLITTLALVIGLVGGFVSYYRHYELALILWLIGRLFDGVDGRIIFISKYSMLEVKSFSKCHHRGHCKSQRTKN